MAAPITDKSPLVSSLLQVAPESDQKPWKSLRPGRVDWTEHQVKLLANSFFTLMPTGVKTVLSSDNWKGGNLVQLKSDVTCPLIGELSLNHPWLRPICLHYPYYARNLDAYVDYQMLLFVHAHIG